MSLGWTKKIEVSGDRDVLAKKGLVQTFIVTGYNIQTILNTPENVIDLVIGSPTEGTSLPPLGSPFPGSDTNPATLELYAAITNSVTTGGAVVNEVEARYSNDRRWRAFSPPLDKLTPGVVRPTFGREKVSMKIPWAEQFTNMTVAGGAFQDWKPKERTISVTLKKKIRTVTIAGFNDSLDDLITKQNDKLHWFDNRWWAFEAGDAQPTSDAENLYEIEYVWMSDPGTLDFGFFGGATPTGTVFPSDKFNFDFDGTLKPQGIYLRPPHHDLVQFEPGTSSSPPKFGPFRAKVVDRDGWKTLPGLGS